MIQKIPAADRFKSDLKWLKSYHLFSFGDYYDPKNLHWGDLRVFNDDTIAPHTGFGEHGHKEMEIVTIVLKGAVTHGDSMGNQRKIHAGMVQRMSAGTGVVHSEYNHEDTPLHLFQIWILPGENGLEPEYEEASFLEALKEDDLTLLAGNGGLVNVHSPARIFYGKLNAGTILQHAFEENLHVFVYVKSGQMKIGKESVQSADQLRVIGESGLVFEAKTDSEFVLIESLI